jgi:hypothetical protein
MASVVAQRVDIATLLIDAAQADADVDADADADATTTAVETRFADSPPRPGGGGKDIAVSTAKEAAVPAFKLSADAIPFVPGAMPTLTPMPMPTLDTAGCACAPVTAAAATAATVAECLPLVGAANRFGQTALHIAARRGCGAMLALLLAAGADTGARNGYGLTPADVAAAQTSDACRDAVRRLRAAASGRALPPVPSGAASPNQARKVKKPKSVRATQVQPQQALPAESQQVVKVDRECSCGDVVEAEA